jgi:hypothetical protein
MAFGFLGYEGKSYALYTANEGFRYLAIPESSIHMACLAAARAC